MAKPIRVPDTEPGLVSCVATCTPFDPLSNPVTPFSEGSAVSKMIDNNFGSFQWPGLDVVELLGQSLG